MKAILIKTTGDETEIEPECGQYFGLRELQNYVGGYIEVVHLEDGRLMILNEEGNLLGLPQNKIATVMAHNAATQRNGIVGDVVVCDDNQMER